MVIVLCTCNETPSLIQFVSQAHLLGPLLGGDLRQIISAVGGVCREALQEGIE